MAGRSRPVDRWPARRAARRSGYARRMAAPSPAAILAALENVIDPELKRPVTELDMVRSVDVDGSM